MRTRLLCLLLVILGFAAPSTAAEKSALDARRIVSLSPHITENLFAIGAGSRVVGTVDFTNYPPAARKIRLVGSYDNFDVEAVAALRPDLVLAWESGNAPALLERLRGLGIRVVLQEAPRIEDVADNLEELGRLTRHEAAATARAQAFRQGLAALRARHAQRPVVRVFYEAWNEPLMTVGGGQIISDAITLCGGENVFAAIRQMAAPVSVEAVLSADPEAIVVSGLGGTAPAWLDAWRRWPALTAVQRENLFYVPPDLIQRHTPRILQGIETLCEALETARGRRARSEAR